MPEQDAPLLAGLAPVSPSVVHRLEHETTGIAPRGGSLRPANAKQGAHIDCDSTYSAIMADGSDAKQEGT